MYSELEGFKIRGIDYSQIRKPVRAASSTSAVSTNVTSSVTSPVWRGRIGWRSNRRRRGLHGLEQDEIMVQKTMGPGISVEEASTIAMRNAKVILIGSLAWFYVVYRLLK